jgi:hypothetical protein
VDLMTCPKKEIMMMHNIGQLVYSMNICYGSTTSGSGSLTVAVAEHGTGSNNTGTGSLAVAL